MSNNNSTKDKKDKKKDKKKTAGDKEEYKFTNEQDDGLVKKRDHKSSGKSHSKSPSNFLVRSSKNSSKDHHNRLD
jgi:hypothetical protein